MSSEFGQGHMRVIELNENDVASQIQLSHGRELAVVDTALDQILQGLDAFASMKQRPDNRLESARLFLATRSFNSLHIAKQILERGYYQQASTLVRMVMEDQLIAEDAESHPPTLDALLDGEGSFRKGELTLRKMAERISPEAKETWYTHYGRLSEEAVHPRRMSLMALITEQGTLHPGGHYDEVRVKALLFDLLTQLVQVMLVVGHLTANMGSCWIDDALPAFQDVIALYQDIDEWAQQQLQVD